MKHLVEFPFEEGGSILVEVESDTEEQEGVVPAGRGPVQLTEKAGQSFEQALEKVQAIATGFKARLGALREPPNEVEVEFGLNMSVEGGAVVAKGGIGANFKVKLKWKQG